MRQGIAALIVITLESAAAWLLLTSLPGAEFHQHRMTLGMSLGILGGTFSILVLWPNPGQIDRATAVSVLPEGRVRWRLVAYVAWGVLLFLSLAMAAVVIFGGLEIAGFLGFVAAALNVLGLLYLVVARWQASRMQQ